VAALEQVSEHPVGEAIVRAATTRGLTLDTVQQFTALPGQGVQGQVGERQVLLGSHLLLCEQQIDCRSLQVQASFLAEQGKTPVYVAVDGQLAGLIAVADTVKLEAASVVQTLQQRGLTVMMLTGDNRHTAEALAKTIGITQVVAQVLPKDKVKTIQDLQAQGRTVAMVGDGINDAPALAQADIGIAIGTGTDVAIETGDMILMMGHLGGVVNAIALSQAILRNIYQNLWGAFIYNLVGIPVAMGVLYPFFGILLSPMLAAATMALSSVTVVINANRLRYWQSSR
jgi:Cu+-exporting ATPase